MSEFERYSKKISWQAYLQHQPPREDDPILRIKNDNITTPPELPPTSSIPNYIESCRQKLNTFFETYNPVINKTKSNQPLLSLPYTREEISHTLTKLRKNKDIIIKVADKSNAIVILDIEEYHKQALSHLQDAATYQELESLPPANEPWDKLIALLIKHAVLLEHPKSKKRTKLATKLLEHAPKQRTDIPLTRPARFYVVMKMHKTPIASRPIASSINTITHNCSKYLDNILQPIMKQIKTYVSSSTQVVATLAQRTFPNTSVLLCLDVEALYPNIPINEGVAAIREYLRHKGMSIHDSNLICDLMHWVLTNNYIEYGDLLFLQIKGTAMGTPFAVVFANLFLAHLEEMIISPQLTEESKPLLAYRFIDDILSFFRSITHAESYRTMFNAVYPTINTTGTISENSGIFLDIEIFKGPNFNTTNKFDTKLYQKSTNKYLYLSPATYHPRHVLTGFISSELKRYRILCSINDDFDTAKENLKQRLIHRNYPITFLQPLLDQHLDRNTLLHNHNTKDTQQRPTFSVLLGPDLEQIPLGKILNPTQTMQGTDELNNIFHNKPPLLAKSHPDNLGQQIIRARIEYKTNKPPLTHPHLPYHFRYNKRVTIETTDPTTTQEPTILETTQAEPP